MNQCQIYNIEAIIGKKINSKGEVMYQVIWEGWGEEYATWERQRNVAHCVLLIEAYEERRKKNLKYEPQEAEEDAQVKDNQVLSKEEVKVLSKWVKEKLEVNPFTDLNQEEIQEVMQKTLSRVQERREVISLESSQIN